MCGQVALRSRHKELGVKTCAQTNVIMFSLSVLHLPIFAEMFSRVNKLKK